MNLLESIRRPVHVKAGRAGDRRSTATMRPDIQGLRAFAVVAVIFDHLLAWPSGGFVGVDIFFVISGFLITGHLLREWESKGRISFAGFYRRRIKRILPAAVLVLVVTVAASFLLLNRSRAWSVLTDGLWAALFAGNWRFASTGTDYFESDGPVSPLQHFWSLAVEEQFYFVWPWVMLVALLLFARRSQDRGRSRIVAGSVIGLLTVSSFAWAVWETTNQPVVAYFSTFSRAWELGVGGLLAIATPIFLRIRHSFRPVLAWLGLAGMVTSLFLISANSPFPAPVAALPVFATALVIVAGTGGEHRAIQPLTNPISRYIGDISYSLYLWHFPVLILAAPLLPWGGATGYLIQLGLIAVFSIAAYHLWEDTIRKSPWLNGRDAWKGYRLPHWYRDGWLAVLAGTTGVAVLSAFMPSQTPVVTQPPSSISQNAEGESDSPEAELTSAIQAGLALTAFPETEPVLEDSDAWRAEPLASGECLNRSTLGDPDACTFGDGEQLAVVVGDSVAMSWIPAISEALAPEGYRVHGVGYSDCPFADTEISVEDQPERTAVCNDSKDDIAEHIELLEPDLVIASDFEYNILRQVSAEVDEKVANWAAGLESSIERAQAAGADVVLLAPNPAGESPESCISPVTTPQDCVSELAGSWKHKNTAEVSAAEGTGARYVDSREWFCIDDKCPLIVDGLLTRSDSVHLTEQYGRHIGPRMTDALLGR